MELFPVHSQGRFLPKSLHNPHDHALRPDEAQFVHVRHLAGCQIDRRTLPSPEEPSLCSTQWRDGLVTTFVRLK